MDSTEVVEKRVYLGGLGGTTKESDLMDRFSSFGQVSSISIAGQQNSSCAPPTCRGFAHFTIRTSEAKWRRLISALNGSSWRGHKLRIEEAKPDYQVRLAREQQEPEVTPARRIRRPIRHRNCGLMTDAQIGKRKGWKRSRYGRAVALVHMRRPDGTLITVDPAHFKDRIEKLFGSVRPLPIAKLTWTYDANVGGEMEGCTSTSEHSASEKEDLEQPPPEQIAVAQLQEPPAAGVREGNRELGFSLSRFLGLEELSTLPDASIPKDVPEAKATKQSHALVSAVPESGQLSPVRSTAIAPLGELLFDPAAFTARPIPLSEYAFCRRSGKEEAFMLWRDARRDLRSDFKQRLKQARKLSRRESKKQA